MQWCSVSSFQDPKITCMANAHFFVGNIYKVKIFVTIKQWLFNKGLCGTENFEVVCSLYQVSVSEYINKDVSGLTL